jgi:hypothetical protein
MHSSSHATRLDITANPGDWKRGLRPVRTMCFGYKVMIRHSIANIVSDPYEPDGIFAK